jgi:hypothetical protein
MPPLDATDEALVALAFAGETRIETVIGKQRPEPAAETSPRTCGDGACGASGGHLDVRCADDGGRGAYNCGRVGHAELLLAIRSAMCAVDTDRSPDPVTIPCAPAPPGCDVRHILIRPRPAVTRRMLTAFDRSAQDDRFFQVRSAHGP